MRAHTFKDIYLVINEDGRVFNSQTGKEYKHTPDRFGYPRIYPKCTDGKRRGFYIHRLLAMAFISNPENKKCVNHINGNKKDYSLSNLEWASHRDNTKHAFAYGLMEQSLLKRSKAKRNEMIFKLKQLGYSRLDIGVVFKISETAVTRAINTYTRKRTEKYKEGSYEKP